MPETNTGRHVTDEERREFLKLLGVTGAVAAGGVGIADIREQMTTSPEEQLAAEPSLAAIGAGVRSDLSGAVDKTLLSEQQSLFATEASTIPGFIEKTPTEGGPYADFQQVESAGRPIYEHLTGIGFFESVADHLPEFTPELLASSTTAVAGSQSSAAPLTDVGFDGQEAVDLITTVMSGRHALSEQLWVSTDHIPEEAVLGGEFVPPMTQQAAGGVLLWFNDLDTHLWQHSVLFTDAILADAAWNAQAMAGGFQMVAEGAKELASGSEFSDGELGAMLTTGFALQDIAQFLLLDEVYWITEDMRGERATNIETITADLATIKSKANEVQ